MLRILRLCSVAVPKGSVSQEKHRPCEINCNWVQANTKSLPNMAVTLTRCVWEYLDFGNVSKMFALNVEEDELKLGIAMIT